MNTSLLKRHIDVFVAEFKKDPSKYEKDMWERKELVSFYQNFSRDRILNMTPEQIYEYISPLWAMLIWGNKHYVIDKLIEDNGLSVLRGNIADLVWGEDDIENRWNSFRRTIKGMGPAMISEILCKTHPNEYALWSRRVYVGLNYLEVENLPNHDYQLIGKVYKYICDVARTIAPELKEAGFNDTSLLAVDYFIWDQLQVEKNLSKIGTKKTVKKPDSILKENIEQEFIHNDIRDKVRDIGQWLGLTANIEQKVSAGSKVDVVWESTIGNMGRVIYVFEVQTKGSIDSLIVNLLKSLNNPAVQGVVAISDKGQLETIKAHAQGVKDLRDKLKYWDYEDVLKVHESLNFVNESINTLGLVPQGF